MPHGAQSVRPSASPGLRSGSAVCLPSEVERLLLDVVADGFLVYCCGPRAAPVALVASYQWEDYVDLVTIRCFDWVTTARAAAPHGARIDVFAPEVVVWAYEGPPQGALRALLDLVHPQHPKAPSHAYPAPSSLHIPRAEQRPMTIQLPPPDRAGMRATRLAAAMATSSPTHRHSPRCVPPDGHPMRSPLAGSPLIDSPDALAREVKAYFLANADRGDNAANDDLIAELVHRIRARPPGNDHGH